MSRQPAALIALAFATFLAACQPFSPEASGPVSTATPAPPPTAPPATAPPPVAPSATAVAPSATPTPSASAVPPTPTATASVVPSPTATPTPVPPTATATPQPTGTISGRLGYPSEGIPALDLYAVRVDDPGRFYLLKTALNQTTFSWSGIAPGHYYILAYLSEQPDTTFSGAFSEFSTCGLLASCPSHNLIPVLVRSGADTFDVQVTDWYAPPGTFPPRPSGTPITTTVATVPLATETAVAVPTAPPTQPPPPAVDTPALPNPDTANMTPEEVIEALYNAINRRDFPYAYALWANNGAASGKSYAEFVAGYATTDNVTIHTKSRWTQGLAGTSLGCVSIVLLAVETNGINRSFAGAYLLRRSNVTTPGGDPNWRILRDTVEALNYIVNPGSQESTELLDAATCPSP